MRILVDKDGVIGDWGNTYDRLLDWYGEDARNIPRHAQQRSFDLHDGLTATESAIVRSVMAHVGFYKGIQPIPGAKGALNRLLREGHDVRIVTSPFLANPTCASEKFEWVEEHIGAGWGARTILTNDKTVVRGDILIDDKPQVTGSMIPQWEHVLFSQPYNLSIEGKRRMNSWDEIDEIINHDRPGEWKLRLALSTGLITQREFDAEKAALK